MEKRFKSYENYPAWFVLFSNAITFSIYILGVYIISGFGLLYVLLYLLYIVLMEIKLLRGSCVDCYYYGKVCFLGRGKIAPLFFKKGEPSRFVNRQITWKDLFPDLLVPIIPLVSAIVLLIIDFSWPVLGALVLLVILGFPVTGYLRSCLACRFCRQREIGCPAEQMLNKGGRNE
ncbi:hypothetical protein ACFL5U_04120 [Candidatus Margulisiibacteriota bacterium]